MRLFRNLILALTLLALPAATHAGQPLEKWISVKLLTGTTAGSAGTRSNVAHGLGRDINLYRIIPVALSKGDNDTNDAAPVVVVKTDSTNVVVKSSGTSVPFILYCFLDVLAPKTAAGFPAELR